MSKQALTTKQKTIAGIISMATLQFMLVMFAFAKPFDSVTKNLKKTAKDAGYETQNVDEATISGAIGQVVQLLLGFMGVIFAVLIIYGGIVWMTAGGDESKVTQASTTIKNSVIGLIIVMSAYLITQWVSDALEVIIT
jgi:small-conductance mechanosensitive channel